MGPKRLSCSWVPQSGTHVVPGDKKFGVPDGLPMWFPSHDPGWSHTVPVDVCWLGCTYYVLDLRYPRPYSMLLAAFQEFVVEEPYKYDSSKGYKTSCKRLQQALKKLPAGLQRSRGHDSGTCPPVDILNESAANGDARNKCTDGPQWTQL